VPPTGCCKNSTLRLPSHPPRCPMMCCRAAREPDSVPGSSGQRLRRAMVRSVRAECLGWTLVGHRHGLEQAGEHRHGASVPRASDLRSATSQQLEFE
jgi:hypothetical protein